MKIRHRLLRQLPQQLLQQPRHQLSRPLMDREKMGREKSGAMVPAVKAAMSFGPPNKRSSHFIEEMPHRILDDAVGLQDFPRQPGDRELRDASNRDPFAFAKSAMDNARDAAGYSAST
jgi:hypothetical protein